MGRQISSIKFFTGDELQRLLEVAGEKCDSGRAFLYLSGDRRVMRCQLDTSWGGTHAHRTPHPMSRRQHYRHGVKRILRQGAGRTDLVLYVYLCAYTRKPL